MAQEFLFGGDSLAGAIAGDGAARPQNSVAWDDDRDRVAPYRAAHGPRSAAEPGLLAELLVRELFPKGNARECPPNCFLESCSRPAQGKIKRGARALEVFPELGGGVAENIGITGVNAVLRRGAWPNSHSGDGLVARGNSQRAERRIHGQR